MNEPSPSFAPRSGGPLPRIAVAVCTYHRNEPLKHLLSVLSTSAKRDRQRLALTVVIVDDSADMRAREVVNSVATQFEYGVIYAHSGARNISKARNLALETALATEADWIAMTDDDCEPSSNWLCELLTAQQKYDADVVTGPLMRRAPAHAPSWLRDQPFLSATAFRGETGKAMDMAFTNNSMIRGDLLRDNQDLRFDPDFGRIGGEDMVFFRAVARRGFAIVFVAEAEVYENEDDDRLNLLYQLRRHFWIGNSSVRTSMEHGTSRGRLAMHGLATLARAIQRPLLRLRAGQTPHLLYVLAQMCEALGKIAGVVGIKVNHK